MTEFISKDIKHIGIWHFTDGKWIYITQLKKDNVLEFYTDGIKQH